jgi:hypothetical protein
VRTGPCFGVGTTTFQQTRFEADRPSWGERATP